jgi:parvulin-like peptidyl-prolyl isomerase
MRYRLIAILWCLFPLLAGAATTMATPQRTANPGSSSPERVVMARVGPDEITVQEFMQFLASNPDQLSKTTTPAGKADLLRKAIANRLLVQEMGKEGLLPEKATPNDYQKAFPKLAEKHFPLPPAPDEKSLRQYYLDHQQEFGIPAAVRLSQIQFRFPEKAGAEDKAAARKRAEAALRRLEGGESFAKLADELTEYPPAKLAHGDLGFVSRQVDPWLEMALAGVKVGQHTGVLESPVGYEFLLITEEREAIVSPFPDVRDKIAQQMQLDRQNQLRDAYVKELAKNVKVEIVQDDLKKEFAKGIFP